MRNYIFSICVFVVGISGGYICNYYTKSPAVAEVEKFWNDCKSHGVECTILLVHPNECFEKSESI